MKKRELILLIANIVCIVAAISWLIFERSWEALVSSLGFAAVLIAQLAARRGKNKIGMQQRSGSKSTNYQAGGDININSRVK